MTFIRKYQLILIGAAAGGTTGYLYYAFIGCASGTCAITSSPVNSTVYGVLMGSLIFSMFRRSETNNTTHEKQ